MKITRFLLAVWVGLLSSSLFWACQKAKLPKPTQNGKNTFGCKINGKNWVPNGGAGFSGIKAISGGFVAIYDDQNKLTRGIEIKANSRSGERVSFYLTDIKLGEHVLNKNTPIKPFAFTPENYGVYFSEDGNQYVTNSKSVGQVTITAADTISRVISGTFSFQCANVKNSSQTVEVSKGRFDINMKTLN